jgi:hypothetical protein
MSAVPASDRAPRDHPDELLADDMAELAYDPLGYARYAYDWGHGDLVGFDGPDDWQAGWLRELGQEMRGRDFDGHNAVMPILMSTVSGHGVGKTALVGIASDFVRSCWPSSRGRVSANTGAQLSTITWAEIQKWGKRSITERWFNFNARWIAHRQNPNGWRLDAMVWDEHKSEAFAGLHAATSVPYYIFDEASKIPKVILETAQGALTDGAPLMLLFGNGTRNSGFFFETHHKFKHRWKRFKVDSRTARVSNKELLDQWIADNGITSDFVKIRVLGDFPNQSSDQFIATSYVDEAMKRDIQGPNLTDPIIFGVDVARKGNDKSCIIIRKGRDARSYPVWYRDEKDTMRFAAEIQLLAMQYLPDAIFVDETGVGGPVIDRLNQLGVANVIGVNNGAGSPDKMYHRQVDYMWGMMRDALKAGLAIHDDEDLKSELTAREYTYDALNAFQLESKDDLKGRGEASPDKADALALTYAMPVGPRSIARTQAAHSGTGEPGNVGTGVDFDPYA